MYKPTALSCIPLCRMNNRTSPKECLQFLDLSNFKKFRVNTEQSRKWTSQQTEFPLARYTIYLITPSSMWDEWWSFTKGMFTTGAVRMLLIAGTNLWMKARCLCSFLDQSNAFDNVPHGPLMDKLACLDIDPYLNWLGDYLLQRDKHLLQPRGVWCNTKLTFGPVTPGRGEECVTETVRNSCMY